MPEAVETSKEGGFKIFYFFMKTKLVPFTFETFPKGIVWIKHIRSECVHLVLSIGDKSISSAAYEIYFADTMDFEISTDLCKTWQPFGVVEEVEEPKRWRAGRGDRYFVIHLKLWKPIEWQREYGDSDDDKQFHSGNYFRTEEEAEEALEKIQAIFKENIEKQTKCELSDVPY